MATVQAYAALLHGLWSLPALGQSLHEKVVDASINVLVIVVDRAPDVGPALVSEPLRQITDESVPVALRGNVETLKGDWESVKHLGGLFKYAEVFGYAPLLFSIYIAVLLFLAIKPILLETVSLPARAAGGDRRGKQLLAKVFRLMWRECLVTMCLVMVLLFLLVVFFALFEIIIQIAMRVVAYYLIASTFYLANVHDAHTVLVYAWTMAWLLFLAIAVGLLLLAGVFYLSKAHQVLRAKFHARGRWRTHGRFWALGTLALLWSLFLPSVYVLIVEQRTEAWIAPASRGELSWAVFLLTGPIFALGFIPVYWAAQGTRALMSIARYPVALPRLSGERRPNHPVPLVPRSKNTPRRNSNPRDKFIHRACQATANGFLVGLFVPWAGSILQIVALLFLAWSIRPGPRTSTSGIVLSLYLSGCATCLCWSSHRCSCRLRGNQAIPQRRSRAGLGREEIRRVVWLEQKECGLSSERGRFDLGHELNTFASRHPSSL